MDYKNKVVLVTGGSRGIGKGIAEKFASLGASLIITSRSDESKKVADEISAKYNVKVIGVPGDVSNEADVKALFEVIQKEFGKLDVCVNNAGISKDSLTMRTNVADFDSVISTNLRSVFLVSKEAMIMMMKEKYGRIINMSSIIGIKGNKGQPSYSASKAGIIGLTLTMANEVASRNITVNAIAPGFINTDMTNALPEKIKEQYLDIIPMKKYGDVEDIAELTAFLGSDSAKYITGQTIAVDGGMLLV